MPEAPTIPAFTPVFVENENTVRARLLANLPEGLSIDVGSIPRDLLEINNAEDVRLWTQLNALMQQMFVWWATGQRLEALAAQYGIVRGTGTFASGNERFYAPEGTIIPPGSIVEAPIEDPNAERIRYKTTNPTSVILPESGYLDVPAEALSAGSAFNQPLGAVTLLDSQIDGVTEVVNATAMTNGSDPDTDDVLRGKVLAQAALPVGSGTETDYLAWGLENSDIGAVAVSPEWDTAAETPGSGNPNGTVLLSLRDHELVPVDWSVVQAVQRNVDPGRQMLADFEAGEPWTVAAGTAVLGSSTSNKQLGSAAISLTASGAGATRIQLIRGLDLSRFGPTDDIFLWVYSSNWANITPASCHLTLREDSGDAYQAAFTTWSGHSDPNYPAGKAAPTSGAGWWLWRVSPEQFSISGQPNWGSINQIELEVTTTGAAAMVFDYLVQRALRPEKGKAPIGAAATVITPVFLDVSVVVRSLQIAAGYSLSETPGLTNLPAQLTAALNSFFRERQPGEPIRVVDLIETIAAQPGVIDFELTEPASNVTVEMTQYAQLAEFKVTS